MKNLNEAGIDELLNNNDKNLIPDISSILSSGNVRKKKKTSIFDEPIQIGKQIDKSIEIPIEKQILPVKQQIKIPVALQSIFGKEEQTQEAQETQIQQQIPEIIISKPIGQEYQEKVINQINDLNKVEFVKQQVKKQALQQIKQRSLNRQQTVKIPEDFPAYNEIIKQNLESVKGEELPDNINFVELEEQIEEALSSIPNGSNFTIADLDIKPILTKVDKSGYFKTVVGIKGENFPKQINLIASYVKEKTKGLIFPRKCDPRVIGNTNKTQLKGSSLKLGAITVVFKPDFEKLKVNKGTRIMISVPENYELTGNLLIYIQESRFKKILEVTSKDFESVELFNQFIGDRIAEYYVSGYDVTIKKLELRKTNNPLMQVINVIVGTHEYKAKPYTDDESNIFAVDFISKEDKNQWLYIQIIESDVKGIYDVIAKNTADQTWEYQISKNLTLGALLKNFYDILGTCFNRDWSKELDIKDEDDNFYYLYDKLKHFKLKKALIKLNEERTENIDLGVVLKETLSKKDTAKSINDAYDAEAIIGKTNFVDYFILSFLAIPVVGGDKRNGADYITTQQYYEKYNVKDRREYEERERTVLEKQGLNRNYNSRLYMFQIEYKVGEKKNIYRDLNFDNLCDATGLLSNEIKFPKSIY
jgi:hypothetical protein